MAILPLQGNPCSRKARGLQPPGFASCFGCCYVENELSAVAQLFQQLVPRELHLTDTAREAFEGGLMIEA